MRLLIVTNPAQKSRIMKKITLIIKETSLERIMNRTRFNRNCGKRLKIGRQTPIPIRHFIIRHLNTLNI